MLEMHSLITDLEGSEIDIDSMMGDADNEAFNTLIEEASALVREAIEKLQKAEAL